MIVSPRPPLFSDGSISLTCASARRWHDQLAMDQLFFVEINLDKPRHSSRGVVGAMDVAARVRVSVVGDGRRVVDCAGDLTCAPGSGGRLAPIGDGETHWISSSLLSALELLGDRPRLWRAVIDSLGFLPSIVRGRGAIDAFRVAA